MGAKMAANLKLLLTHFQNGVLFKSKIAFRKLTPPSELQTQEKKSKRSSIGCGQQSDKIFN